MARSGKESGERANGRRLVTAVDPRSAAAEAYRTLRTNLEFSSLDRELRLVLVTSASADEGKSTVLANLAVAVAETGREVLAVDSDLRRPSLHEVFGAAQQPGLTDLVLGAKLGDVLQRTAVPGLALVSSGPIPPNPAEVMASSRLAQVLDQLRGEAAMVLLDTPPVGYVSDAAVLAAHADGVLLVLRAGRTRRDAARRAKQQLEMVGARILGVVLNDTKVEGHVDRYARGR